MSCKANKIIDEFIKDKYNSNIQRLPEASAILKRPNYLFYDKEFEPLRMWSALNQNDKPPSNVTFQVRGWRLAGGGGRGVAAARLFRTTERWDDREQSPPNNQRTHGQYDKHPR